MFQMGAMTFSGDSTQEEIDELGRTMFWCYWNVPDDIISVRFSGNLSRKKKINQV